jgi:SOS response regulatory protein OraA/RecX
MPPKKEFTNPKRIKTARERLRVSPNRSERLQATQAAQEAAQAAQEKANRILTESLQDEEDDQEQVLKRFLQNLFRTKKMIKVFDSLDGCQDELEEVPRSAAGPSQYRRAPLD